MAPLSCSFSKVLLVLCLLLVLLDSSFISAQTQDHNNASSTRIRRMLELDIDDDFLQPIKKKSSSSIDDSSQSIKKKSNSISLSNSKNQTKLIKSTTSSSKNQTKLAMISSSSSSFGSIKNHTKLAKTKLSLSDSVSSSIKNQTKLAKTKLSLSDSVSGSTKNKTKLMKPIPEEKLVLKSQLKKLNSTSSSKYSNSTKTTTSATKKLSSDLSKISTSFPKNKTTKATTTKDLSESKSNKNTTKNQSTTNKNPKKETTQKNSQLYWLENDEDDLLLGFRDLPSKFQETLLPDLERISKTSQVYLNKANKEMTKNFKPIVGNKYAPTIASVISFAFILIPLILVSLIFNRIKAYFSLQRLLIFIQVYLSIYFSILCLSSLVTGLEPLKFFYATAQSTYICLQLLQTLAYVLYLLMLLMYLVLVFSTETGPITKMIGLAQTFVGFAVGLHYYMTVFHKAVLRQPPKTSWRIHAIYATCFLLICLLSRADRIKKTYLEEGGEEGKKS
ncbi:uncharacterized protein LOC107824917 [Nicotiana tabacum]|uniref:Uncharacterized protein F59B10.2-like n=2 Tax=Nicotiana TaxID=4085 RepID=A0A1S4D1L7_TOBAC|nr:PREDICTED: uncharacterized protein F59B10.2-like [Nicotiana sylvestris]XP_016507213.1 PREDICTED: uncharacterized protein F59B10.2-like [Nicotiana tabacum]